MLSCSHIVIRGIYILDNDVDIYNIYNYADDNSLVCSGYDYDDVKSKLLSNVNKVIKWFESNHMKVNEDKFQCIVFGKKDNLGNFRIGDHDIVPEDYVKLLGLHVDRKLNFNTRISNISQRDQWKLYLDYDYLDYAMFSISLVKLCYTIVL